MNNDLKFLLILMIKNESKILERCLTNVLPLIDAVCICDTGSTDDTISIANRFLLDKNIKYRIFEYPFTDFGESRTRSFQSALTFLNEDLKWDPNNTFGFLVDADMVLKYGPDFDKSRFSNNYDCYKILQIQGSLEYYNIRFVLMSRAWKCIGKTHEVWTNFTPVNNHAIIQQRNFLWFDDVSDGGCKDDKLERDERLLLKGIEEEPPLAVRYYFYLGQTYYSMSKYEKAIEYYKKRSDIRDGFDEEIWFSLNMICYCYYKLEDYKNFEKYAIEAYEFYPCRAETLLMLVSFYKNQKDYVKAWKYLNMGMKIKMPEKQILYLLDKVYFYDFYFEKSHLLYLTNPENLEDIRDCFCHMLNYKKISEKDLVELLKTFKSTLTNLVSNSREISYLNDDNLIKNKKENSYYLINSEYSFDENFDNISLTKKPSSFNEKKNIKFLSENIYVDFADYSYNIIASNTKVKIESQNFIPVLDEINEKILLIDLEILLKKLPHFVSKYFLPTMNNFVLNNQVFLLFYNPNTLTNLFVILSEDGEISSFVPPFCVESSENNEFILATCPSFNQKELVILYKINNDKTKISKIEIETILSKKMSLLPYLQ